MVSIRIADLTHEFDERTVFAGLNYSFAGSRLAVCGRNGSGKSTLLRIIAGLLTPTSGTFEMSVNGAGVTAGAVGIAAPDIRLYSDLTPRENLRFLGSARGLRDENERVGAALEKVGLLDRADDRVKELSTGLRQRACLAAAIMHEPVVLLLDEPSSNLDEAGTAMLRSLIDDQALRGMVILATNDPVESAQAEARLDLGT